MHSFLFVQYLLTGRSALSWSIPQKCAQMKRRRAHWDLENTIASMQDFCYILLHVDFNVHDACLCRHPSHHNLQRLLNASSLLHLGVHSFCKLTQLVATSRRTLFVEDVPRVLLCENQFHLHPHTRMPAVFVKAVYIDVCKVVVFEGLRESCDPAASMLTARIGF